MRANSRKVMLKDEFLLLMTRAARKVRNLPRATVLLSLFLGLALLLSGCPPSSSPGDGRQTPGETQLPELTDEIIRERINDAFVSEIPEENAAAEPINWNFDEDEPKEITVVEKQLNGERATIVLDIKTRSATYMRNPRSLAGQIRTEWALKTGWVLRKWEIVYAENISMKYKNLPKPSAQNSNR